MSQAGRDGSVNKANETKLNRPLIPNRFQKKDTSIINRPNSPMKYSSRNPPISKLEKRPLASSSGTVGVNKATPSTTTIKQSVRPSRIIRPKHYPAIRTAPVFSNPPPVFPAGCRKSISMIEMFSPQIHKTRMNEEDILFEDKVLTNGLQKTERNMKIENDKSINDLIKKSGIIVCHMLLLNSWRKKREEVVETRGVIEDLSQQVDHLQLQIVVLRRLLDTENSRVSKLGTEVHRTKAQLENISKQRDTLNSDKLQLENDNKTLHDLLENRNILIGNLKNELFNLKNQLIDLDKQIEKDREKLLKLREDKKILLEKVTNDETRINECGQRAIVAEKNAESLLSKLEIQDRMIETLEEDKLKLSRDLKVVETERIKVEKNFSKYREVLNIQVKDLEIKLNDREAALRRTESAYNSQLKEIKELKERLIKQSEESGWSSKMLQIAGSVVRAPRAILRTLSFLSIGGGSSQ